MRAKESYDRVAPEYTRRIAGELEHKPLDRELLRQLVSGTASSRDSPICDLGCGPGHVARFLHDTGAAVVGIDLSPGMVAEARRLNPDIEFRVGDMGHLDVPAASFSGVAAFYSVLHIPRAEVTATLREIRRVLVPGGLFLLTFHIGHEVRHSDEFFDQPVDLDFVFFEVDEMERYLQDAGFREIETIQREPYPDVEVQTRRAYIFSRA